ncbi:MAG: hypothetical protein ACK56I_16060, partial [bacterium]
MQRRGDDGVVRREARRGEDAAFQVLASARVVARGLRHRYQLVLEGQDPVLEALVGRRRAVAESRRLAKLGLKVVQRAAGGGQAGRRRRPPQRRQPAGR